MNTFTATRFTTQARTFLLLAGLTGYRALPVAAQTEDHATRAALAVKDLTDHSRFLDFLSRHDTRCDRQYTRSHQRLLELRQAGAREKNKNRRKEPTLLGIDSPETIDNTNRTELPAA